VASRKRFTTGGGFPYDGSPGRPIEFTLSYGRSDLLPNPDAYTHRLEFSDPEDSAYVCGMYGPPRDNVGLQAFADQLAQAYREVADDPEYEKLPVPPLKFRRPEMDPQLQAESDIAWERVARSCLWARQFGPGTKLSIDLADGAGSKRYRARAMDNQNRIVGHHSAWPEPDFDDNGSASALTASDRQNPGFSAGSLPVRYLSRRIADRSDDTATPAAPGDPSQLEQPQQGRRLPGLVSGKPMDHLLLASIFGLPEPGAPEDEDWLLRLLAPRRGR